MTSARGKLRPAYLVFALAATLGATAAAAQSGGITVRVVDAAGTPLAGATVTISHETGSVATTAQRTDRNGVVEFPVLRPGAGYAVRVAFPGLGTVRQTSLRVRINETLPLVVQLLEQLEERVKVTAQRPVIDIEESESATRFSDTFIQDLPVPGRFYQNILTMAPGVQDNNGDGNPNVHGSRARDFKAVVSGISNVDPLTGQWMSRVNPNSIEEMEVITAGAGVEFGRAQGGFANIIQKQGSNRHEGLVEFYWRSSELDGTGAADFSDLPEPEFDWIQPSVQFSGPLIKDRLWYRFSHEYREIDQPVNILSGIQVTRFEEATHADQLTWQVSPRNKLAFQFSSDPKKGFNLGINSFTGPESALNQENSGETYSLTWTSPYSPRVLVESQVAWQDLNFGLFPSTQGIDNDCIRGDTFVARSFCSDLDVGRDSGSYHRTVDDRRQRLTVTGKATLSTRFWGMGHQFKIGLGVENERYFRDLRQDPFTDFFVVRAPRDDPDGTGDLIGGGGFIFDSFGLALPTISIPQTDDVRATGTNWHVYAEDQFRPVHNLSVTLGVRVDRVEIGSEGKQELDPVGELQNFLELRASGFNEGLARSYAFTGFESMGLFSEEMQDILCENESINTITNCRRRVADQVLQQQNDSLFNVRRRDNIDIANTNFSPHIAVNWAPWADGKTAFGFTAGRYYNNLPLVLPLQELEPLQTTLRYRVDLGTRFAVPDRSISPAIDVKYLDRGIQTPYQDELTFTIERELWPETALELRYIRREYRDQIQDFNVNRETGDYGRCQLQTVDSFGPHIVASPGISTDDPDTLLFDPFNNRFYKDTDPGNGDGRIDDCAGVIEFVAPANPVNNVGGGVLQLHRPDNRPDLYYQNPFWGDIFVVSNLNRADYDAVELVLTRRQFRSWELNTSYTWSRAEGDGEDFFQEIGNDPSLRDDAFGYQSYDQRHVVKLNATTVTPWGMRLGTAISWQSGLPFSILQAGPSFDVLPPVFAGGIGFGERPRSRQTYADQDGRSLPRNSARNASYWNFDVKATKEVSLARDVNLQISAEVFNAFGDGTYVVHDSFTEVGQQVNASNEAYRRFGRRWQLGMRLSF